LLRIHSVPQLLDLQALPSTQAWGPVIIDHRILNK